MSDEFVIGEIEIGKAKLIKQTEKAGCFQLLNDDLTPDEDCKPEWIPWSHVGGAPEKNGDVSVLYVSTWMAQQKGWD